MRLLITKVFAISVMLQMSSGLIAENLIINGDFEDPVIARSNSATFDSIPGWIASEGRIEIQVGERPFVGEALSPGQQFVELDSSGNSAMYQDVPSDEGNDYLLEFFYSPRNRISGGGFSGNVFPASTNVVEVYWEGSFVDSLAADSNLFTNEWSFHEYNLIAMSTTGLSRLEFVAAGRSDSIGGLLDKVTLTGEIANCTPGLGDIDGDGVVQFSDLLILAANFGSEEGASSSDLDCDGAIGFSDFLIMSENYGTMTSQTETVPEPQCYLPLIAVSLAIATRQREKRYPVKNRGR